MPRQRPPPPPQNWRAPASHGAASGVALKEENIYIPAFISKRPFYFGDSEQGDYLEHQRSKKIRTSTTLEVAPILEHNAKALARTKYKKGACENCGADGHKAADCLERPRKKGAKWTGKDIKADDQVKTRDPANWEAKRDRWFNYDPREHSKTVARYEELEELKRLAHEQERRRRKLEDEDEEEEGDKYAEEIDMGKHQPTSTKQLRIREDTAKYLLNLDVESAKYDPKIRKIINPGAISGTDRAAMLFAEEGFLRSSGDAADFDSAQRYAWEAHEKTGDSSLHLQANPTAGEVARKKAVSQVVEKKQQRERELRDRYGVDDEMVHRLPEEVKEMVVAESETFVEYDELGLVKGAPRTMTNSKYQEDEYINNHSSVWGSWWHDFRWGYKCCRSFVKNSYCTGEEGIKAWEDGA